MDSLDGLETNAYDYWMEIDMARPSNDETVTPRLSTAEIVLPPDLDPASFDVAIVESPDEIEVFNSDTVGVEVTNVGEQQDTQSIELSYDGSVSDSDSVTLGAGESQIVSLETPTFGTADVGTVEVEVSSDDSLELTSVEVVEEGEGGTETDPDIEPPQSPTDDRYLNYWLEFEPIKAVTKPYSDLLGPVAALITLFSIGGAIQINSDSTTLPLVLTVLLAGVIIGTVALPASAVQVAAVLVVLGVAFLGVRVYLRSGDSRL
jgi:hypothetical protein